MRKSSLSEADVRTLLDRDILATGVSTSRDNKINRSHYATLLGCSRCALTPFQSIFANYERKLGIVTGPMRHLTQMRDWLTAEYEARRLDVRDGKVDRTAFTKHFGYTGSSFIARHSGIRDLLNEFDMRAQMEAYMPSPRQKEFDSVVDALKGDPVLHRDKMTISLVALAQAAAVPLTRLKGKRIADAIATRQAEIDEAAKASKINPYFNNRVFSFGELMPVWSSRFLERVGTRFRQTTTGMADARDPYRQLLAMLTWVGSSNNPHCQAVTAEASRFGFVRSADDWEDSLFAYRDSLVERIGAGTSTIGAIDSKIGGLRIALDGLASGKVIPLTSIPLPGLKNAKRLSSHRMSVAEAPSIKFDSAAAAYLDFARSQFEEACRSFGIDCESGEAGQFMQGLAVELRAVPDLAAKGPAATIRSVLQRRLSDIRDRAAAIVNDGMDAHCRGSELLAAACIDGATFECNYFGSNMSLRERTGLLRSLFADSSRSKEQLELGLANLLSFIDQRHGGIPPLCETAKYGQFFARRYRTHGGLEAIVPLLIPSPETIAATLTLYLVDSGANISVGRTLDGSCMEPSDLENHCRITGNKSRAKGKPIIVDLPDASPAVRAIKWLQSASRRLQVSAGRDSDRLFLMRIGARVQLMTPQWYTSHFKRFVASIPSLQHLNLVPNMIRSSVLLEVALGNDGRLAVGQSKGQHGLAVSQGYQQKWPTRLLYDENTRRFQNAFEVVVLSNVEDAAARLGIAVASFEARLHALAETGLGTLCMHKFGRSGETTGRCRTIDCWNDCPHLLVVAEVEAMAVMQLWQQSLRAARADWERDRPERWDAVWLPWLCLTDVVEEKMARGPLLKIWKAAVVRAASISASPGYIHPHPF